jgi:prophage tail gpP-like protein
LLPNSHDAEVRLQFANGEKILYTKAFRLDQQFTDPLESLSFTCSPPEKDRERYSRFLNVGEQVVLKIDGMPQATMLIVSRTRSSDGGPAEIEVDARSMLVTAYEGSVDYTINKSIEADKPVSEVILEVMGHYGFTEIDVDPDTDVRVRSGQPLPGRQPIGIELEKLKERDLEASPGESAYQFCSRVFSRLGVVLRTNAEGKLLLSRPNYNQDPVVTLIEGRFRVPGAIRCLPSVSIRESNEGLFSEVVALGRKLDDVNATLAGKPIGRVVWAGGAAPAGTPFSDVKTKLIDFEGNGLPLWAYRSPLAPYKSKIILAKKCRDQERAERFAEYTFGLRNVGGYMVECEVRGFKSPGGHIWCYDQIVRFRCSTWDIDEQMWVLGRTFSGDDKGGYKTKFKLIPKGALQLGDMPN